MDKIAYYEDCIYKMAEETEKIAVAGAVLANAVKSFAAKSVTKKALTGAGLGAVGGALTAKPSTDENGNLKSNKLSGALQGALVGGMIGSSIKAKVPASNVTKDVSSVIAQPPKQITGPVTNIGIADKGVTNTVAGLSPKKIQPVRVKGDVLNPNSTLRSKVSRSYKLGDVVDIA
ncbi:MAG: hypothetical protein K0R00_118 [Herbinix sp.]|jgi:hypothetical protein|nr:hypothetical protein [Herbinix sp.]